MASVDTTEKILDRITKLLAHAEGTTIAAEAESFTARAQSLMQQYAVEAADLEARTGNKTDKPVHVEVRVQHPYTEAKSTLLHNIARQNRCRMVYTSKDAGIGTPNRYRKCTIFGMGRDVAFVELMYASLSVQCVTEMLRTPIPAMEHGKTFRNNFIYGYASRINQRLEDMNAAPENAPTTGAELVFVGHKREIDHYVHSVFPRLSNSSRGASASSAAGRNAGGAAANRANLNRGNLGSNSTRSIGAGR